MAQVIEAYATGQEVCFRGGVRGIVTAVLIRGLRVSYEVAWWDGRVRCCEYVESSEIIEDWTEDQSMRIGFRSQNSSKDNGEDRSELLGRGK